jgi:hypothetical protein
MTRARAVTGLLPPGNPQNLVAGVLRGAAVEADGATDLASELPDWKANRRKVVAPKFYFPGLELGLRRRRREERKATEPEVPVRFFLISGFILMFVSNILVVLQTVKMLRQRHDDNGIITISLRAFGALVKFVLSSRIRYLVHVELS